ncbi:hypothetical protein GCM10023334_081460 [Nonomuraea thailandensis]
MAEDRIPDIMRDERMGHLVQDVATQQQRLESALIQRADLERCWAKAGLPRRSPVGLLDRLLEPHRKESVASLRAPLTPRLGGRRRSSRVRLGSPVRRAEDSFDSASG